MDEEPTTLDFEYFRNRLLERKRGIAATLDDSVESAKPVNLDHASVGRLSRMDALQQQAMTLAMKNRLENELQRIESGLRRLEKGEYGLCIRCEEPIPRKRLEVDPATLSCIQCAQ